MITVDVPGSKSVSNRAFVLASLSDEPTLLRNVLECDDVCYLRQALSNFGVGFKRVGPSDWQVTPAVKMTGGDSDNYIGNGGTPARFLAALSLVVEGRYGLRGVDRMHERPFQDLFEVLEGLGVELEFEGQKGFLPAHFGGYSSLKLKNPPEVSISGAVSSQFLSGLLLTATKMPLGLKVLVKDQIPSRPYVEMTVEMIRMFGGSVEVLDDFKSFHVESGLKGVQEFLVPADCSSVSYPLLFGMLSQQEVMISNFGQRTLQGDEKFLEIIQKAGGTIERKGDVVKCMPPEVLLPLGKVDFSRMPDVSMTAMALAAFADGESHFVGLESLRIKECDRIAAMNQGLSVFGVKFEEKGDEVIIEGKGSHLLTEQYDGALDSFDDHRIAMVFGVLRRVMGLKYSITDPHCVAKSWPDFWIEVADWSNQLRLVSSIILKKQDMVDDEPDYLIVKKPRKSHAWQFPQGGVDPAESLSAAAIRELKEECGENIRLEFVDEKRGEYRYLFPSDFDRHEANILGAKVSFFQAEYKGGEIEVDGKEIIDYKWVKKSSLKDHFEDKYWRKVVYFL